MDTVNLLIAYDRQPLGTRATLAVGITTAQHAATMRAIVPPGDAEGSEILEKIKTLQTAMRRENPDTVVSIFIHNWSNNERTERESEPSVHDECARSPISTANS